MITGFSLAPWSEIPPPLCASGQPATTDGCKCFPRYRGGLSHKITRNGTVIASSIGNIVSVACQTDRMVSWGGEQPTSADVQIRPFVRNGNAFIHIIDGRVGRIITVTLNATYKDGNVTPHIVTLEIV